MHPQGAPQGAQGDQATGRLRSICRKPHSVPERGQEHVPALLHAAVTSAACMVCGRPPDPARSRLTVAQLLAVLPLEFAMHAVILSLDLPYAAKVVTLAVVTTILAIWVVEPSTMHLLRGWLHAPAERRRDDIVASLVLSRIRVTVDDTPGSLERLTHHLTRLGANILTLRVHPLEDGVLDELEVATDRTVSVEQLRDAVVKAGGRHVQVEETTSLALVDVETRALDLANRVASHPADLEHAVASLLNASVVTDRTRLDQDPGPPHGPGTETLKVPSPGNGALLFDRPGQPFTPAESARAHRLAQLAEAATIRASQPDATQ